MKTIYLVHLESVETRYTCQWRHGIPKALQEYADAHKQEIRIVNIVGDDAPQVVTPGAFLNFAGTNIFKSQQAIEISKLFASGEIKPGDKMLFMDAWNTTILQVKYMAELLNVPVELLGIWHAGSYDPQDFLGRLIDDKRWSKSTERAIWNALDYNIYATDFHIQLFIDGVFGDEYDTATTANEKKYKFVKSGQPHEGLIDELSKFANIKKRPLILFPHRVAPEKQPEIFRDLAKSMPQYEWIICQDQKLTKEEYHTLLGESRIIFSANLQETLGISSCIEAPAVMSVPLVPDRLSYKEIFDGYNFTYPSEWTTDYNAYLRNKDKLMAKITDIMDNYYAYLEQLDVFHTLELSKYATGHVMFSKLIK